MEAAPPRVGSDEPAYVRAEIVLDTSRLADYVQKEWDSLQTNDVVYLLEIRPPDETSIILNGHTPRDAAITSGLTRLRTATVTQFLDENGRMIRDRLTVQANGHSHRPGHRKLIVNLDPLAYKADEDRKAKGQPDVYGNINIIVRRKGRENNFKRILESIKSLTLSDVPVPDWLQEVFLGYGNPAGANYTQLENRLKTLDFRDTFVDWQHLIESFPSQVSLACTFHGNQSLIYGSDGGAGAERTRYLRTAVCLEDSFGGPRDSCQTVQKAEAR